MNELQMAELLLNEDEYLIVTHINPDGDTVGCAASLCRGLRKIGKKAEILYNSDISPRYARLCEGLYTSNAEGKKPLFVDVAAPDMMCKAAKELSLVPFAVIDHHLYGWKEIQNALVDHTHAAAGELVYLVLKAMNAEFDEKIAEALYVAISTDTGCFRFGNTTAETHRITAELLKYSFCMEELNRELFETRSPAAIALEKEVLCGMRYEEEGRIALISVSREMRRRLGVTEDDMEHISSIPRTVEGVDVGITLKQLTDETGWRVSLRTTPAADASAICGKFGGGGHARAAGCTVYGDIETVMNAVLSAAKAAL